MRWLGVASLVAAAIAATAAARGDGGVSIALVAAETQNELIAVSLPSGRILRRLAMPADPENVEVCPGQAVAVVVSSRAGAVSLVDTRRLRVERILRGFRSPHIAACTPDGEWAYVTDDAAGTLSVIELATRTVVGRIGVGRGAHHVAISPEESHAWVALGERAREIVVLDTQQPGRPRVVARFDPGFAAHDLAFTPDGRRVWITSANRSDLAVYDAATHRAVVTLATGSAPQHVAFLRLGRRTLAYVTSGYAGTMQIRNAATAALIRTISLPVGSFNIGAAGAIVVSASLLNGTLTELSVGGRIVGRWRVAPVARDAAVFVR